MTVGTNVVGAYRKTTFFARFTLVPGQTAAIHLTYYCRYWEMVNNSAVDGVVNVGSSRAGVQGTASQAGFNRMFPGSPPRHRRFLGDDEGPPVIYVHAPATNDQPQDVEFEYYPSAKRSGEQPTPGRGKNNRSSNWPTAQTAGGLIVPGI